MEPHVFSCLTKTAVDAACGQSLAIKLDVSKRLQRGNNNSDGLFFQLFIVDQRESTRMVSGTRNLLVQTCQNVERLHQTRLRSTSAVPNAACQEIVLV